MRRWKPEEKEKILEEYRVARGSQKGSAALVLKKYGVHRSLVDYWRHNKDKLASAAKAVALAMPPPVPADEPSPPVRSRQPRRWHKLPDELGMQVIEEYQRPGGTIEAAATKYGVHHTTFRAWCARKGIPIGRQRGESLSTTAMVKAANSALQRANGHHHPRYIPPGTGLEELAEHIRDLKRNGVEILSVTVEHGTMTIVKQTTETHEI